MNNYFGRVMVMDATDMYLLITFLLPAIGEEFRSLLTVCNGGLYYLPSTQKAAGVPWKPCGDASVVGNV